MAIIKDKYSLSYSEDFDIKNIEELEVNLDLTESDNNSSSITGTVVDNEGEPISGATVKLFDENGKPYLHVLTNELGNYVFDDLAAGTYSVTAVADGATITIPQTVILNSNDLRVVDFTLEMSELLQLGTIAGIIKELFDDTLTIPLGNAKIFLKDALTDETIATTLSAADGEFCFYGIENGDYDIVGTKDGYRLSNSIRVSIRNGNIVNATLLIVKDPDTNTGTVSGFIKYNNIAIPNVYVGLYELSGETGEIERCIATTRTNDIGYYMFGNVKQGNYIVKAKQNS